jgi:hypothetical protein
MKFLVGLQNFRGTTTNYVFVHDSASRVNRVCGRDVEPCSYDSFARISAECIKSIESFLNSSYSHYPFYDKNNEKIGFIGINKYLSKCVSFRDNEIRRTFDMFKTYQTTDNVRVKTGGYIIHEYNYNDDICEGWHTFYYDDSLDKIINTIAEKCKDSKYSEEHIRQSLRERNYCDVTRFGYDHTFTLYQVFVP